MKEPVIANREVTLHILRAFGIHMSKKLGQNFLIDSMVVEGIVRAAGITAGEQVLEIGPGIGTLTQGLAETGANVLAVELDERLIKVLEKTLAGYDNVRILHQDILKLDVSRAFNGGSFKVVANLPYYITTPIILKLLEEKLPISVLVTMIQKEVAERMVAKPGTKDYGALSVAVQYYTEPKIQFIVPPSSFIPSPSVHSAVISCRVRTVPPVTIKDEKTFFMVVKAAFAQRRKTLSNALKAAFGGEKTTYMLDKTAINGMRRGETLSLEEFGLLSDALVEVSAG